MIAILQFSLTDIRKFTEKSNALLPKPFWLSPTPFREFIRGIGPVIPRYRGGMDNWINEKYICKIHKGILVEKNKATENHDEPIRFFCRHKHIYSDGICLTKYEFVFEVEALREGVTAEDILHSIFQAKVRIINKNYEYEPATMGRIFAPLLNLHILLSTRNTSLDENFKGYIIQNTPQVFIYLRPHERLEFSGKQPVTTIKIPESYPFSISTWEQRLGNNPVKMWMCAYRDGVNGDLSTDRNTSAIEDFRRKIRISLFRYYCEQQSLRSVLLSIKQGLINVGVFSEQSNELQSYFKRVLDNLKRENYRFKDHLEGEDWIASACDDYLRYSESELMELEREIKKSRFRPQIEGLIMNHIQGLGQFAGANDMIGLFDQQNPLDVLIEKLNHIREALAIETDAATIFKYRKQIEQLEKDIALLRGERP